MQRFQSINIPNEWGCIAFSIWDPTSSSRFQSINIPNEWGLVFHLLRIQNKRGVSNQLISPTSGDTMGLHKTSRPKQCFQSINIPNEWGLDLIVQIELPRLSFQSINIPNEWGSQNLSQTTQQIEARFPIN